MKTDELVSIIIPCYNQAIYLEEAVQSAVNQTYVNLEIIIVNDGSTDNTQDIAEMFQKRYPDLIRVIRQDNKGLSEARNTAIKNALGKYILPFDSDDIIHEDMIKSCVKTMNECGVDIVSTDIQAFGAKNYIGKPTDFPECQLLYKNCLIGTSLFKREVWETIGGYKKNMSGGYEDWEFWINAYKHGFKFKRCPEILFYYRIKDESMYTEAIKKDKYLRSKIILNHPSLYPEEKIKESINTIQTYQDEKEEYFSLDILSYKKDLEQELIAYKHLSKYQNSLLLHYSDIKTSILDTIRISMIKHPIEKYRAYKRLLKVFNNRDFK